MILKERFLVAVFVKMNVVGSIVCMYTMEALCLRAGREIETAIELTASINAEHAIVIIGNLLFESIRRNWTIWRSRECHLEKTIRTIDVSIFDRKSSSFEQLHLCPVIE